MRSLIINVFRNKFSSFSCLSFRSRMHMDVNLFVHRSKSDFKKKPPSKVNIENNFCWRCKSSASVMGYNCSVQSLNHVLTDTLFLNQYSAVLFSTLTSSKTCWNCNNTVKAPLVFCEYCGTLQPVSKHVDLFQILDINRSYKIDYANLRQKYRNLQTLLHPDKFSSKPKKEQELSEEFSSLVNKAYSTLLDPLERGLYLLSLHQITIGEGTTDLDKTFLMEIMERNEEIANETDPQKLREFYTNNKDQLNWLISKTAEAFDSNDVELAKEQLTKMKYYHSIETKIKEIKQKLNIPD